MRENFSTFTDQLVHKGIRPSFHRLKIFAYLNQADTHPTVEEIFADLSPQIPTLSKATVYNTLHTLIEAGLVREVNIDLDAQHYDVMLENHGHFRCFKCGQIFNFDASIDQIPVDGLQNFQIVKKDVYFSGLCPACQRPPKYEMEN